MTSRCGWIVPPLFTTGRRPFVASRRRSIVPVFDSIAAGVVRSFSRRQPGLITPARCSTLFVLRGPAVGVALGRFVGRQFEGFAMLSIGDREFRLDALLTKGLKVGNFIVQLAAV
jgi:hypothetical protein